MRWALLAVVGCWSSASDPPAPSPAVAPDPDVAAQPAPAKPPGVQRGRMHATWSDVHATDGCWFFSGPDGRDTKLAGDVELARDGQSMRMTWGNATFTGTFKDGELALTRTTSHDYDGTWRVTEHIRGKYVEGAIHARYRYEECEHDTACPNRCTITATLDLVR